MWAGAASPSQSIHFCWYRSEDPPWSYRRHVFAPRTGQFFAFQFPQQDLYAWDTSAAGTYGQFVKLVVINESKFHLVNQLYNMGKVVGAPNGQNLSICYKQVLNNLVPSHENDCRIMAKQQDHIHLNNKCRNLEVAALVMEPCIPEDAP